MPFLRGTTPIWGTQDLPGRFKEWKACLVEIGQTAHKLETNARANFPMAENLAYQCMENAEQRYHQLGQLTHFHCTIARRGPPHLSGSHVSYVSLADVRKIWQCTTTPNPHVNKV